MVFQKSLIVFLSAWLGWSCKSRLESQLSENADKKISTDSIQIVLQDILERRGGLNPYTTNNPAVHSIARFVYEPLAVYTTNDPFTEEPKPLLAEKIEYDDQAKFLTITLRKGIKFHNLGNGFKLTGNNDSQHEKAFALGNASSRKTNSHAAYELTSDDVEFSLLVASHLVHASAHTWLQGANLRVEKLDKYKLKVFWNPNETFTAAKNSNYVIAYKILSTLILPKKGMDYEYAFDWSSPQTKNFRDALKNSFIEKTMWGTGPYQFSSRPGDMHHYATGGGGEHPGVAISYFLDRNYEYWGIEQSVNLNVASTVPFASIEMVGNMTVRQEDLLHKNQSAVSIAHFSAFRGKQYPTPSAYSGILAFPLTPKHTYHLMLPFQDAVSRDAKRQIIRSVEFRRGLSQLFERSTLTRDLNEHLTPANSFFGHGPYADSVPIESNNGNGILAIRNAGFQMNEYSYYYVQGDYPGNFKINHSPFDETGRELAYGIRQILDKAGFRVTVPSLNSSQRTRFENNWYGDLIIRKIKHEDFPDPRVYWHTRGASNDTGFSDSEVDQQINLIHSELDPSRFYDHYHKLDRMLKDKMPSIPLVEARDFVGLSSKMQLLINQNQDVLEKLILVLDW